MEGIIRLLAGLLAMIAGLYSLLIFIRIMLNWFSNAHYGKATQFLAHITDPYLDWWQQRLNLRAGSFDLSPIAGIVFLSIVQTICSVISRQGSISPGIVIVVCLSAIWSAVSFIIAFCAIILGLRLIGYMTNSNMYSRFWQVINSISQPVLYRINRIIFGKRVVRFLPGMIVSIIALIGVWILGKIAIQLLISLLMSSSGLPG